MRLRRAIRGGSGLGCALALLAFACPASADVPLGTFQPCGGSSWVGGSTDICKGTLLHRDYVNDDYGADTGGVQTTDRTASLAPSAGDQSYPDGKDGTADLVRLTLRVKGDRLLVSGELNALYKSDSTVLAVAIDSDDNQSTGGGKWGALNVSSNGWDQIAYFQTGDPGTNTISGDMPLPPGTRWRVQAATAIRANGQVMNVAFRGVNEHARFGGQNVGGSDFGSWFEDDQAAALGKGDISQFGTTVDVASLRKKATVEQPIGPGLHGRVYTSQYTLPPGEGVDVKGVPGRGNGGSPVAVGFEQTFQYLGRYQPYGIYIPKHSAPSGMQMVFHGSSSVMTGLINQPGMQQRFGEDLNRFLVVPEARGQNGFGSDISERDLLDVMDDVEANYPIDRERVFSGGYSQGGYITYRMAETYPDRFAAAVDWVGFTGNDENGTPIESGGYTAGAVGNVIDLVQNMRWVPASLLYAGADELVHLNTAIAMDNAFKASDNIFTFYLHPAAEHLTFATLDDWRKEAKDISGYTLAHDPPRVTYRYDPVMDSPNYGISHNHAYWISSITNRGKGYGDLDLTNHGCGGSLPTTATGSGSGGDPLPWSSDFRRQTGIQAVDRRPFIEGDLGNVSALTIDSARTCTAGKTVTYKLTTDGPATVCFSDGRMLQLTSAGTHEGTVPAAHTSACGCITRSAAVSSKKGIAGVAPGMPRGEVLAHAPQRATKRAVRWCVEGGGRVLAAFDKRDRVAFVASTARRHRANGLGPGASLRRLHGHYPLVRSVRPRLEIARSKNSRIAFGVKQGRARFVAVADRAVLRSPRRVRAYLRALKAAGMRL